MIGDLCAPICRAQVACVPGEDPLVAFQVFHAELQFAIDGFLKLFNDGGSGSAEAVKTAFDIFDKDRERLGAAAGFNGSGPARTHRGDHDPRPAQMQLRAGHGIAVAEVLHETKDPDEPVDGFIEIPVKDVWQHRIDGNRAIVKHGDTIPPCDEKTLSVGILVTGKTLFLCMSKETESAAMSRSFD
jgi:hypothetical protein